MEEQSRCLDQFPLWAGRKAVMVKQISPVVTQEGEEAPAAKVDPAAATAEQVEDPSPAALAVREEVGPTIAPEAVAAAAEYLAICEIPTAAAGLQEEGTRETSTVQLEIRAAAQVGGRVRVGTAEMVDQEEGTRETSTLQLEIRAAAQVGG